MRQQDAFVELNGVAKKSTGSKPTQPMCWFLPLFFFHLISPIILFAFICCIYCQSFSMSNVFAFMDSDDVNENLGGLGGRLCVQQKKKKRKRVERHRKQQRKPAFVAHLIIFSFATTCLILRCLPLPASYCPVLHYLSRTAMFCPLPAPHTAQYATFAGLSSPT